MIKYLLTLCCFWLYFGQIALASSSEYVQTHRLNLGVSLGFGGIQSPLKDGDNVTTLAIPHVTYYGERWYFDDFCLGYSLIEDRRVMLDIVGTLNTDGFFFQAGDVNRTVVAQPTSFSLTSVTPLRLSLPMEKVERDLSYLGGLALILPHPVVTVTLAHFHDISGVHNGSESRFNLYKSMELGNHKIAIELGAVRKSQELINYYYQFNEKETFLGAFLDPLPAAINKYIKLDYAYPLSRHFSIKFQIKQTFLDSQLIKGPMIDRSSLLSGFAGVEYRF
ncbi:hypothetical protein HMF8227_01064 [Saliniradius amylolyticus]|uniref:MipA/OmpV family protein n=1 Tax=Saliniradius amylolyticus TaxID=2183582 RepID=A0A2S2E1M5_9ALTE|nr:MipA/OmpV family protein [Saliniradius amylolyticus]AWL11551.1 hypothetical protein HMF8227_01064 [Saliniradius amylolyticus]